MTPSEPASIAYLDHASTTPMRPEVLDAMLPYLTARFGNPSGAHAVARAAKTTLEEARERIADLVGARPADVVFTSGATEADNLAVLGAARAARAAGLGDRVVVSAFEHAAVLGPAAALAGEGFDVHRAPVGRDGVVAPDEWRDLLDERTVLVSLMLVNNEVGTVQPVAAVASLVAELAPEATVHCDAAQAPCWVDVAEATGEVGLVVLSAHKFGGPPGAGMLVRRGRRPLAPLARGGGQERELRPGTVAVANAVGTADALARAVEEREEVVRRVTALRDDLVDGLRAGVPGVAVHGDPSHAVPSICNVGIAGVESESLLVLLDRAGVCVSVGSACASGAARPSHVLRAMGLPEGAVTSALRFSLGWCSTAAEVRRAVEATSAAVARLRAAPAAG